MEYTICSAIAFGTDVQAVYGIHALHTTAMYSNNPWNAANCRGISQLKSKKVISRNVCGMAADSRCFRCSGISVMTNGGSPMYRATVPDMLVSSSYYIMMCCVVLCCAVLSCLSCLVLSCPVLSCIALHLMTKNSSKFSFILNWCHGMDTMWKSVGVFCVNFMQLHTVISSAFPTNISYLFHEISYIIPELYTMQSSTIDTLNSHICLATSIQVWRVSTEDNKIRSSWWLSNTTHT